MDRSRIAILIPALNEEATIGHVVERVSAYGVAIVIDDGSTDKTADLATSAHALIVRHALNLGYDAALSSGMAAAKARGFEYAITIDADGQHNPTQLISFIQQLEAGYDVVVGIRDRKARFSEVVFSYVAQRLWKIFDPLCGMKGYRLAWYDRVGLFSSFKSIGTELAIRIVAGGGTYSQIPITTRERKDNPRFGNRIVANFRILKALGILGWLHCKGDLRGHPL